MTRHLTDAELDALRYWMPLVDVARHHPLAAVVELQRRRREGMEYLDPEDDFQGRSRELSRGMR